MINTSTVVVVATKLVPTECPQKQQQQPNAFQNYAEISFQLLLQNVFWLIFISPLLNLSFLHIFMADDFFSSNGSVIQLRSRLAWTPFGFKSQQSSSRDVGCRAMSLLFIRSRLFMLASIRAFLKPSKLANNNNSHTHTATTI